MRRNDYKMIDDYIYGEPLDEKILDKIENSLYFMKLAINKTGDYKLYNLCSDRLKCDFNFVRFLIHKFRYNIDFVCTVADYYLSNTKDDINSIEIIITMCKLTKNDITRRIRYLMQAEATYQYERLRIEMAKKEENDEFANEVGMGFYFIFDTYSGNRKVLDFYAKKIINGIFEEYRLDLEEILHQQFKLPNDIDKVGINNYLINFIGSYDFMLGSYLSAHIELLIDLKDMIEKIKKRWNQYNEHVEHGKYLELFEKVHEYLVNSQEGLLDETTLLYYMAKKLNIIDKVLKYDNLNEVLSDNDESYIKDVLEYSFQDRINLSNVKKIMIDTVLKSNLNNDYHKTKILHVDFGKK